MGITTTITTIIMRDPKATITIRCCGKAIGTGISDPDYNPYDKRRDTAEKSRFPVNIGQTVRLGFASVRQNPSVLVLADGSRRRTGCDHCDERGRTAPKRLRIVLADAADGQFSCRAARFSGKR